VRTFGNSRLLREIGESEPERPRRRKTGGRKKGTPNKKSQVWREMIRAALGAGKDPKMFFAEILRTETNPIELRFAAARELLPYMHPRLTSVESRTGGRTHEDRLEVARKLLSDD